MTARLFRPTLGFLEHRIALAPLVPVWVSRPEPEPMIDPVLPA